MSKFVFNNKFNRIKTIKYAGKTFGVVFRYALLLAIGYIVLFPMLSAVITAIKAEKAFFDLSLYWIPK